MFFAVVFTIGVFIRDRPKIRARNCKAPMNDESIYYVAGNNVYILVKPEKLGRKKKYLILTIQLAREKINALQPALDELDDGSDEYDELQEKMNDYEMLISDCEDRFEDLLNIPQ